MQTTVYVVQVQKMFYKRLVWSDLDEHESDGGGFRALHSFKESSPEKKFRLVVRTDVIIRETE